MEMEIEQVTAQNLGDAQYRMLVGNRFNNIMAQPLSEFHHQLLMTGKTKVPPFT
jgi:hypothetical protein